MSIVQIPQYKKNPTLRRPTTPVTDINDPKVQQAIQDLRDTLLVSPDGIGLAAPQIGYDWSIFAILQPQYLEDFPEDKSILKPDDVLVFINPEITKYSAKKNILEEGCLSFPQEFYYIKRPTKITLKAWDEHGQKIKIQAKGFLARVFQHEIDHLNKTLIVDKKEQ